MQCVPDDEAAPEPRPAPSLPRRGRPGARFHHEARRLQPPLQRRRLTGAGGDGEGHPVGVPMNVTVRPSSEGDPGIVGKSRSSRSSADGAFRVGGLEPGTYDLVVSPSPHEGDQFLGGVFGGTRVEAVPAGRQDLIVRLFRGKPIAGRVVDEKGKPVRGRKLLWITPRGGSTEDPDAVAVQTDDWGGFQSPAIPEGRPRDVVARPWEFPGTTGGRVDGVEPGTRNVVLVVGSGGVVRGRVLTAEGKPVPAGVPVRTIARYGPGAESYGEVATETGKDGSFVLGGLGEDPVVVTAGGKNSAYAPAATPEPVTPGGDPVEIRVHPGATLAGRLVDGSGNGAEANLLMATQERPVRASTNVRVEPDGTFRLDGLAPGAVTLRVYLRKGSDFVNLDLGTFDAPASGLEVVVPEGEG